ncbi:MAG: 4Fe-4S cluster-binding domain-containing protein [Lentisphaeria bacterium]|nr:4Fe-4S cluster-binding domain-containing protein [Lentisphaeria bacterium]
MKPCADCVRKCGVMRPETLNGEGTFGFCGCPRNPVVARAMLHRWEEPCISGKNGSGAVFFSGCNLRCVFCQNYEISSRVQGKEITAARLREIYGELIAQGAHNINLVTPGHYTEAILASLDQPLPVPVVYNSNGYDSLDSLQKLDGKIQIYLPDLKYADNALAARYSHAPDYFETATAAIDEMFRQTGPYEMDPDGMLKRGVVVRHLILPGQVENSLRVIDHIAHRFKPGDILFSLMRQYVPHGRIEAFPELNRRVSDEEYEQVEQHLFDSPIEDGFVQEEESASEEFIPAFDNSGV